MQIESIKSNASIVEGHEIPFEFSKQKSISQSHENTHDDPHAPDFLEVNQVLGIVDEINFVTKLVPNSAEIENDVSRETNLKMMKYTQHEFLKMSEVQFMINEAVQLMAEKLRARDAIITANKEWLRKVDYKVKNMDAQVVTLLKLTKQVGEHHKKIKNIAGDLDQFNCNRMSEYDQQSLVNHKFENQLADISVDQKKKQVLLSEIIQKNKDQDITMHDLDRKVRKHVAKEIELVKEQINIKSVQIDHLDHINRDYQRSLATIQEKLRIQQQKDNAKLCEMMRFDNLKMLELELKVRNLNSLEAKVSSIDQTVSQLIKSANQVKEIDQFNTRSLPLLIHLQVSEAVKNLVITKNQQINVAEWDTQKLIDIDKYLQQADNISSLRHRIEDFTKLLMDTDQQVRSIPFQFTPLVQENDEILLEQIPNFGEKVDRNTASCLKAINDFQLSFDERCKFVIDQIIREPAAVKSQNSKITAGQKEVQKQSISKINTTNLLNKNNEEDLKTQTQILNQQSMVKQINVRYIDRLDYKRLRQIENRHRDTIKKLKQIYDETTNNYDDLFEDMEQESDELKNQITYLTEVSKVISQFLTEGNRDIIKLKKRLSNVKKQNQQLSVSRQSSRSFNSEQSQSSSSSEKHVKKLQVKKRASSSSVSARKVTSQTINKDVAIPVNQEMIELIQNKANKNQHVEEQLAGIQKISDDVQTKMEQITQFIELMQLKNTTLEQSIEQRIYKFENEISNQIDKQVILNAQRAQEISEKVDKTLKQIQTTVVDRQLHLENQQQTVIAQSQLADETARELKILFDRDYQEFIKDRRRWKSDFDLANKQGQQNFQEIEELLNCCLKQNQINTQAIKMMHDVLMISQLCERQDAEDRKQIGLYGTRTDREILNQALADDHTQKGPEDLQNYNNIFCAHENKQHQVIKVDPACLQCSGNQNQVIHQLKLACLSYTSSPVPYQSKMYALPDLLKVKGKVISECQRLIRDHLYKSKAHDGAQILKYQDERSYVIEPLLEIKQSLTNVLIRRLPEIHKSERVTIPISKFFDKNIQQVNAERESQNLSQITDTVGDSVIRNSNTNQVLLAESFNNSNRVVISRQSRQLMTDDNIMIRFNAFSPMGSQSKKCQITPLNQQQINLANEQRLKSKIGSRAGQIDSFATSEMSSKRRIPDRPTTQFGMGQSSRYEGYSKTIGSPRTGMAGICNTNRSLELNIEKEKNIKLEFGLSIDGQQIGFSNLV